MLFFIPVIYTLTFGGLFYKNSLTEVPIIVCNLDDGFRSQALIRDLYDTPEVEIKFVQMSPMDFEQTIIREKVSAIVARQFNRSSAQVPSAINISTRMLYNPTGGYTDFFPAALILHAGQIATVFTMGPSFSLEKKYRRRELAEYPFTVLAAKLFVYVVYEVAVVSFCLAIGIGGFKMICRADFGEMMYLVLTFIFCMMCFALFVGSWVKILQKAITLPLFYIMPSVLFAGAIWPRTSMDNFSLFLSYIMPIGYSADNLRRLPVKGSAAGLQHDTTMMLLLGCIFFALAFIGVKRYVGTDIVRVEVARP